MNLYDIIRTDEWNKIKKTLSREGVLNVFMSETPISKLISVRGHLEEIKKLSKIFAQIPTLLYLGSRIDTEIDEDENEVEFGILWYEVKLISEPYPDDMELKKKA